MESTNNKDNNQNKSKYLIENIFVSETDSQINNTITYNKQFNYNIKEISLNIPVIDPIIINDKLTFFYKKYSNEEKEKLKHKFNKLLYFCYRKNTYPMKTRIGVGISRDSGWGCMIRCGQMIMSRAIYKYLKSKKVPTEKAISETLKYFLDAPYSEQNMPSIFSSILFFSSNLNKPENTKILPPFSIQVHCLLGKFYNKYAGEWFSDVNICKNYRDINEIFNILPEISIINFVSDLNLSDVLDNCFTLLNDKNENNDNKSKIFKLKEKEYIMKKCGLIFVSVRLGISKVTNEYYSSLKKLFECKECLGIIGGETNLAHYFIGYNDKGNLIYLDPHITRDAVYNLNDESITNDYLIKNLHEIAINDMSTGLSVGFLFRNIDEFEELVQFLENYSKNDHPCFGFIKEKVEIDINKYEDLFNDEDDF